MKTLIDLIEERESLPEGEDWYNPTDVAREKNADRRRVGETFEEQVRKGLAEKKRFRGPDGKMRFYYRLIT